MSGPLAGIRVLEFTSGAFGGMCGMVLGDLGASVIKVEGLDGEPLRYGNMPGRTYATDTSQESYKWLAWNRSKRSLSVDIKQQEGLEVALKLADRADVLVQSFRPGVMERLGLGYADLSKRNSRLIYCSLSGYGEEGPLAHRICGDMWAQAFGGVIAAQGTEGQPPYLNSVALSDHAGAVISAFGVLAALFARERTGQGQKISNNLVNSVMFMQSTEIAAYLMDDIKMVRRGRGWLCGQFPFGAFRAKDRDVVSVFGSRDEWPKLCDVLGMPELGRDPRYDTQEKREALKHELYPHLDAAFSQRTAAEWVSIFRASKMRVDPAQTYDEMCVHPQTQANDILLTQEHPNRGKLRSVGVPVKFEKTPARPDAPPPLLGQHTRDILAELGYDAARISELTSRGVVRLAE